jgi:hypothetical protein
MRYSTQHNGTVLSIVGCRSGRSKQLAFVEVRHSLKFCFISARFSSVSLCVLIPIVAFSQMNNVSSKNHVSIATASSSNSMNYSDDSPSEPTSPSRISGTASEKAEAMARMKLRKAAAISRLQQIHSAVLIQTKFRMRLARARMNLKRKAQEEHARLALIASGKVIYQKEAIPPSVWPATLKEDFSAPDRPIMTDSVVSHRWLATQKKLFVRVITWNLCGQMPPPIEDTCKVLIPGSRYHIYVIGSEECERTIAQSAINPSKRNWEEYLSRALGADYVPIRSHTLQAIHLMVFAHYTIARYISCVSSAAVSTGIGNTLGNKGGVGVYFIIGNTSLVFVNAHCAAHQNAVRQRNADCARICSEIPSILFRRSLPTVKYLSRRFNNIMEKFSDDAIIAKHDELWLGPSRQGRRAQPQPKNMDATSTNETNNNDDEIIGLAAIEPITANLGLTDAAGSKHDNVALPNSEPDGEPTGHLAHRSINTDYKLDDGYQAESAGAKFPYVASPASAKADTDDKHDSSKPVSESKQMSNSPTSGMDADGKGILHSDSTLGSKEADTDVEEMQLSKLDSSKSLWNCADRVIFMGDLNYRIKGKRFVFGVFSYCRF